MTSPERKVSAHISGRQAGLTPPQSHQIRAYSLPRDAWGNLEAGLPDRIDHVRRKKSQLSRAHYAVACIVPKSRPADCSGGRSGHTGYDKPVSSSQSHCLRGKESQLGRAHCAVASTVPASRPADCYGGWSGHIDCGQSMLGSQSHRFPREKSQLDRAHCAVTSTMPASRPANC